MVTANHLKPPDLSSTEAPENPIIPAFVVSETPGRVRFRMAKPYRKADIIEKIGEGLRSRLEIYRVRTHIPNGSLTVFYSQQHSSFNKICQLLENYNVIIVEPSELESENITQDSSLTAAEIRSIFANFNEQIKEKTDNTVDLRLLFSLSLGGLAIRQLMVKGLQLEAMPWYVLAWYAFDSFVKLHTPVIPEPSNASNPKTSLSETTET
ncbi:MAG: HMA2 domain-containing protein [Chroococcales cyanobacterium]